MDRDKLAAMFAEAVRAEATKQGNVPFLSGDLRKSVTIQPLGGGKSVVTSNLPYSRAVHDGRPAITIRPKKKKALAWPGGKHPVKAVRQPKRKGKPFITDAATEVGDNPPPEFIRHAADELGVEIEDALKGLDIQIK